MTPEARERRNAKARNLHAVNKEGENERNRVYRQNNPGTAQRYRDEHRDERREDHLKRRYSITLKRWEQLLKEQGHTCALCGSDRWGPKGPQTEHCHTTNKVRGIVCQWCNQALSKIKDNPETALKMHRYLVENLI